MSAQEKAAALERLKRERELILGDVLKADDYQGAARDQAHAECIVKAILHIGRVLELRLWS